MDKLKIGVVSLGCDKNRVDSEIILGNVSQGYDIVNDPKTADIILVNTCGFIETAKQESINSILEMGEYKNKYNCKMLIATGCLTQRYGDELLELIPELDVILGVNDYSNLGSIISNFIKNGEKTSCINYSDNNINTGKRVITTGSRTAYIRISEGCNNFCTYCIIPKIRGKYRSRLIEDIIAEAEDLASQGIKEIILIAQDTTNYGIDIYGKKLLHELVNKISGVKGIEWIRILYCYPEEITDELIHEIADNEKVCKYIDIPLQHINNDILKDMRRKSRKENVINTINKMRENIKGLTIRTSIIVGFPGETEEQFNELKEFVEEIKFGKLGVFKYSQEEGTIAAEMTDQIEEEVKKLREFEIMSVQQQISAQINKSKIGNVYDVLIESWDGERYQGRNYEMAPEIDGAIFIKCDKILNIGEFVKVKIVDSLEYDLIGVVCDESCE